MFGSLFYKYANKRPKPVITNVNKNWEIMTDEMRNLLVDFFTVVHAASNGSMDKEVMNILNDYVSGKPEKLKQFLKDKIKSLDFKM